MWTIEHPNKAYRYLDIDYQANKTLKLFALIRETKYYSFPSEDIARLEASVNSNLSIRNVQIKSPDNPVKQISAKLISYQI